MVQELQPPDLLKFQWWNIPLIVLLLAAAVCVSLRGCRLWDLAAPLCSALFFSLRMQARTSGTACWSPAPSSSVASIGSLERRTRVCCLADRVGVAACIDFDAGRVGESSAARGKTIASCHDESYPVAAVEFVQSHHLQGPLYNTFDWGGYLIWALAGIAGQRRWPDEPYGAGRRVTCVWYGKDRDGNVVEDWEDDRT